MPTPSPVFELANYLVEGKHWDAFTSHQVPAPGAIVKYKALALEHDASSELLFGPTVAIPTPLKLTERAYRQSEERNMLSILLLSHYVFGPAPCVLNCCLNTRPEYIMRVGYTVGNHRHIRLEGSPDQISDALLTLAKRASINPHIISGMKEYSRPRPTRQADDWDEFYERWNRRYE